MAELAQTIAVAAMVALALVWVIRSFYRSATGKDEGCACGKEKCPLKSPHEMEEKKN